MLKLFLAFTLVPALEIYLFVKLGGAIGLFNTLLVVLLTGVVGAGLARWQGAETMLKIRQSLQEGGDAGRRNARRRPDLCGRDGPFDPRIPH